jgi:hypothetical protein
MYDGLQHLEKYKFDERIYLQAVQYVKRDDVGEFYTFW